RARHHFERAVAAYDHRWDPAKRFRFGQEPGISAMLQLAVTLWQIGEVDRAMTLSDEGFALAARSGHVPTVAYGHMYRCMIAVLRRDGAMARPSAGVLVALSREHGPPSWLAMGTCLLDWARWWTGERDTGTTAMREAIAFFQQQGHAWYLTICPALLA